MFVWVMLFVLIVMLIGSSSADDFPTAKLGRR